MYCCTFLENMIRSAGEQGLAILVCKTDEGLMFAIQMRSVAVKDIQSIAKQSSTMPPVCMTVSGSVMIRYCPSCGKLLSDLIPTDPEAFKSLGDQHEKFQDNWGV